MQSKDFKKFGGSHENEKRSLVTTKVYGFNPWMDQLLAVNQIMESLAVPALKAQGKGTQKIARLHEIQSGEAKNFAYGLAEEIRDELSAAESNPPATVDCDDRQGRFSYYELDATGTQGQEAD